MKVVKLELKAVYTDELGDDQVITKVVSVKEYDQAAQIVSESRWGNSHYMTTVTEETVARCLGVSACNYSCSVVRRYLVA